MRGTYEDSMLIERAYIYRMSVARCGVVADGACSREPVPASPDPLFRWVWDRAANATSLQVFSLLPVQVHTDTPASFGDLQTLLTPTANVLVQAPGTVRSSVLLQMTCL